MLDFTVITKLWPLMTPFGTFGSITKKALIHGGVTSPVEPYDSTRPGKVMVTTHLPSVFDTRILIGAIE